MDEKLTKELQELVYGYVTVNHNSFMRGCEIHINTPTLSFVTFINDADIERCKNYKTLIEQVIIEYELKILKHFIKKKGGV